MKYYIQAFIIAVISIAIGFALGYRTKEDKQIEVEREVFTVLHTTALQIKEVQVEVKLKEDKKVVDKMKEVFTYYPDGRRELVRYTLGLSETSNMEEASSKIIERIKLEDTSIVDAHESNTTVYESAITNYTFQVMVDVRGNTYFSSMGFRLGKLPLFLNTGLLYNKSNHSLALLLGGSYEW